MNHQPHFLYMETGNTNRYYYTQKRQKLFRANVPRKTDRFLHQIK